MVKLYLKKKKDKTPNPDLAGQGGMKGGKEKGEEERKGEREQ